MKNEPIIAYNHLSDEQEEKSHNMVSDANSKKNWRMLFTPVALVIEVAAIITMLILMIEELLH